jgi:hypothetical protein
LIRITHHQSASVCLSLRQTTIQRGSATQSALSVKSVPICVKPSILLTPATQSQSHTLIT